MRNEHWGIVFEGALKGVVQLDYNVAWWNHTSQLAVITRIPSCLNFVPNDTDTHRNMTKNKSWHQHLHHQCQPPTMWSVSSSAVVHRKVIIGMRQ